VPAADQAAPVSAAEARTLFASLRSAPALLLAVSGGPDSTALMMLAARWRAALKTGPKLFAVTVDHGLRADSAGEARAVSRLARQLDIRHRTVRWIGSKPETGLQEAARAARYRLLAAAARLAGAAHILTGHTLDDQAETVLLRMARGSGMTGLAAMARETPLKHDPEKWAPVFGKRSCSNKEPERDGESIKSHPALAPRSGGKKTSLRKGAAPLLLVRPLLELPKARLIATLDAVGLSFADDPSNRDPRFTRSRWRELMPALAGEGLDARRLAVLARRLRRAEATIESAVDAAASATSEAAWKNGGPIRLDAEKFIRLPAEVALRLLGRAIAHTAGKVPLRLGRLEALYEMLAESGATRPQRHRIRRTLAGALVTLAGDRLTIERAPPRSHPAKPRSGLNHAALWHAQGPGTAVE
jgi:tRNA(Ile)-lysidine synthase